MYSSRFEERNPEMPLIHVFHLNRDVFLSWTVLNAAFTMRNVSYIQDPGSFSGSFPGS
jgi:hypothetical protein